MELDDFDFEKCYDFIVERYSSRPEGSLHRNLSTGNGVGHYVRNYFFSIGERVPPNVNEITKVIVEVYNNEPR